jgi:hypothetical protein
MAADIFLGFGRSTKNRACLTCAHCIGAGGNRFKAFEQDVNLLVNNAKKYNIPGSAVYEDAVSLQKVLPSI